MATVHLADRGDLSGLGIDRRTSKPPCQSIGPEMTAITAAAKLPTVNRWDH